MKSGLQMGAVGELLLTVGTGQTIHLGVGGSANAVVFSTPSMIALMEHTARHVILPFLDEGEASVGVTVNVEHLASTPLGSQVRAVAKLTKIDGKQMDFEVEAYEEKKLIGKGTHRRAVIKVARLAEKMASDRGLASSEKIMPTFQLLKVTVKDGVATVRLDHSSKLNIIDRAMTEELSGLLTWLQGNEQVRVVILTGNGQNFSAGEDLKETHSLNELDARANSAARASYCERIKLLPQIVISAVQGYALGGGCVLSYFCDFRLAATNAQFGMPEVLNGWSPAYGIARLISLVGRSRAEDLLLTGRQFTAQEALEYGLIHRVVPAQQLLAQAETLASDLLKKPALALRETKRRLLMCEAYQSSGTHPADLDAYRSLVQSPDARKSRETFLEKSKKPSWQK